MVLVFSYRGCNGRTGSSTYDIGEVPVKRGPVLVI